MTHSLARPDGAPYAVSARIGEVAPTRPAPRYKGEGDDGSGAVAQQTGDASRKAAHSRRSFTAASPGRNRTDKAALRTRRGGFRIVYDSFFGVFFLQNHDPRQRKADQNGRI